MGWSERLSLVRVATDGQNALWCALSGGNGLMMSGRRSAMRQGGKFMREEQIIFEQIAEILSGQPAYKMANRTGLSRSKIRRMAQGIPFNLDYNVVFALGRLGYHLELVENGVGARWWPQKDSRI